MFNLPVNVLEIKFANPHNELWEKILKPKRKLWSRRPRVDDYAKKVSFSSRHTIRIPAKALRYHIASSQYSPKV